MHERYISIKLESLIGDRAVHKKRTAHESSEEPSDEALILRFITCVT
jgi:hypothetical protein